MLSVSQGLISVVTNMAGRLIVSMFYIFVVFVWSLWEAFCLSLFVSFRMFICHQDVPFACVCMHILVTFDISITHLRPPQTDRAAHVFAMPLTTPWYSQGGALLCAGTR